MLVEILTKVLMFLYTTQPILQVWCCISNWIDCTCSVYLSFLTNDYDIIYVIILKSNEHMLRKNATY